MSSPPPIRILYKNYKGEIAWRSILPKKIWFGVTEWHPEPQWLLDAEDLERHVQRSFALKDIQQWDHS